MKIYMAQQATFKVIIPINYSVLEHRKMKHWIKIWRYTKKVNIPAINYLIAEPTYRYVADMTLVQLQTNKRMDFLHQLTDYNPFCNLPGSIIQIANRHSSWFGKITRAYMSSIQRRFVFEIQPFSDRAIEDDGQRYYQIGQMRPLLKWIRRIQLLFYPQHQISMDDVAICGDTSQIVVLE